MVNLYRLCIAILFASISFAIAQECKIEKVPDTSFVPPAWLDRSQLCSSVPPTASGWTNCVTNPSVKNNGDGTYTRCIDHAFSNGQPNTNLGTRCESGSSPYPIIEKEICIDPKPDLTDWENCKSGKDHGFSWIIIGDGNGEGESRFKQEFWACDDPDIWIVYNHPPEDKPTDPEKPTDPTDPKDPEKPGEGGEGGDDGSGNGNDGGSDGGNDNGSNNGGDQNGTGLTKGEIQEAVEGALDSKGKELEGKINKWWLTTQSEMNQQGTTMGHEADSMLDDAFAGMIVKRDINDFEREYRFQINAPKACPAPMVIEFIGFQATVPFDLICKFSEMIGYLVLASAYMSAIYIIMGLRRA